MFPTTPPAFINTALLTHSFLFSRGKCGAGADVQVLLGSLDGRRFTAEKAQKPIWFGEVAVGAKQQRVVRVSNLTPLPLPFCWQQTDHPISSGKPRTLLLMLACLIRQASLASILAYLLSKLLTLLHSTFPHVVSLAPCY